MRKRLLALSLVLAFAVALVVPSFGATSSDVAGISTVASFSSLTVEIKDSLRVSRFVGADNATLTHIATVEQSKFAKDTDKISWKAIAAKDVALDGTMDINKIVTGVKADKPMYLLLGKLSTEQATYKTYASISSISADVAVFAIKGAGAKVSAKVKYVDENDQSYFQFIDSKSSAVLAGSKYEYTLANDVNNWSPLLANAKIEVLPYAQEFWIREAGTATAAPGPYASVKVAALQIAPVLKLDFNKGEISGFKANMQVNGATATSAFKKATLGSKTSIDKDANGIKTMTFAPGDDIEYRIPTDGKKPGSALVQFYISDLAVEDGLSEESFTLVAGSLKVNGTIPVQLYDATTKKWKTIKEIKPDKTSGKFVTDGYLVRLAGTKAMWAGEESTLKVSDAGVITCVAVNQD